MNPCPDCVGRGVVEGFRIECGTGGKSGAFREPCRLCEGSGEVTSLAQIWREGGEQLRVSRLARDMSLREFARVLGVEPSKLSDAEFGRVDPTPMRKTLRTVLEGSR